jgi:hypothetical protein
MKPAVRYVSTSVALALVATTYFVLQPRPDRPGPPRPSAALSAPRPPLPPAPPTAREILGRSVTLDLRDDQRVRLEALERLWHREISGLEAEIGEAEREFSGFVKEAQGVRGMTAREIQRRGAELSQLSAELRERRQRHSEAALRVLADWQRTRLAQSRPIVVGGKSNEAGRN